MVKLIMNGKIICQHSPHHRLYGVNRYESVWPFQELRTVTTPVLHHNYIDRSLADRLSHVVGVAVRGWPARLDPSGLPPV